MISARHFAVVLLAALPLAAGCASGGAEGRARETTSTAATLNGPTLSVDHAAVRLARVRCERDTACASGAGRHAHYADEDECLRTELDGYGTLRADVCPHGVNGPRLTACLEATRTASCALDPARANDLVACSRARLCMPFPL